MRRTNYLDRRIIGLPVEKRIYAGTNSGTLMAKTGYEYDDDDFLTAQGSSIPQFDATNYGSTFYYRGNLWKVRQYEIGTSNYKDSKIGYNTTGSVILTRDPLDHDTEIAYDTSYLAYPLTVTDPDGNHADVEYNFYTGQRTRTKSPTPDSGSWSYGVRMDYVYDSIDRLYTATRVKKVSGTDTNNANTSYYYATTGTNVTTYTTIKDLSTLTVTSTITDGEGRTIATATEHPGSSGGYKAQTVHYDIMGRADQTSNPTEISSGFSPYGDDYTAGWQYTEQTYDWKGRPLVTTNPDSTTRAASYTGCGCAGSEVDTLEDEGTMISSTLTRRKQKIYSDVLGRTVKAETYEWNGTTVYSTVKNTYNALDQVTQTRQFAGDDSSSTYQDTTYSFDGYGRLHQSHRPEQFETDSISLIPSYTYTTFAYNADDTTASVTDARGAETSFTYNNRRLVTDVDYSVPGSSSIAVPASVDYEYDDAGNRISMTDGLGTVNYAYDQFSRLTDETRDFTDTLSNEPSGHYRLQYAYDLVGLASITDAFGATVEYAHDAAGQNTEITGSGDANTDDYASNLVYRAWGALKSTDYGNGHTMSASYNNRQQPTEFEISDVMHNSYDYEADGRMTFSHDLTTTNSKFDRLMSYDQSGRLTMTRTGAEARNPSVTSTNDRPYKEDMTFDEFDNMTQRAGKFWWVNISGGFTTHTYTNNRDDAAQYDVDGRMLENDDVQYEYDAAGRVVHTESDRSGIDLSYDGDGNRVKSVNSMTDTETPPNTSVVTTYYLPSTVAGQPITELTSTGAKQQGYVFAGSGILAVEKPVTTLDKVLWRMTDAAGFSIRATLTNGNVHDEQSAELDHFGTNAELQSPVLRVPRVPGEEQQGALNHIGFGDPFASGWYECISNGIETPCGQALANSGGLMSAPSSRVGAIYSKSDGRYIGGAVYNPTLGSMGISVLGYGVGNNVGWLPAGATLTEGGVNMPSWFAVLSANEWTPNGATFVSFNAAAMMTAIDNAYYGGAQQQQRTLLGTNPFPTLTGDKLTQFQNGLNAANAAFGVGDQGVICDEALKSLGIPSLKDLVAKMGVMFSMVRNQPST